MADIQLIPGIIKNGSGQFMAPKTFSELVYMSDGNTLDNILEDIYSINRSCVIKTKTYSVVIERDKQKVFNDIPTPMDEYDLEKGILFILDTDKKLIDSSAYIVDMDNRTITFNVSSIYNNFTANNLLYLIYVYADNAVTGGDYSVSVIKRAIAVENKTNKVSTGLTFTKGLDTFLVYKNSVYIEEDVDYIIGSNGNTITLIGEDEFFNVGDILNFVLISNTNKKVVSLKSTSVINISSPTNITKVPIKIKEYSRSTDSLFVYMNGTYLEVDQDYYITNDSKYIQSTSSGFQVSSENVRFDFIVFKNICNYTDIESNHTNETTDPLKVLKETAGLTRIFNTIACIGDSVTKGYADNSTSGLSGDYVEYSYPTQLAKITNCNVINWGVSGATTGTWLEGYKGSTAHIECFDGQHKCDAYIIGLGGNDYLRGTTIGTIDGIKEDYNDNANSFYGNMDKIIRKIKEVQPKARIFICTYVVNVAKTNFTDINNRIRELVNSNRYTNTYLIDLDKYARNIIDTSENSCDFTGKVHQSAIGYLKKAYAINTYIDWIIRNNPTEFKDIQFMNV